jgi:hypothetical protein
VSQARIGVACEQFRAGERELDAQDRAQLGICELLNR